MFSSSTSTPVKVMARMVTSALLAGPSRCAHHCTPWPPAGTERNEESNDLQIPCSLDPLGISRSRPSKACSVSVLNDCTPQRPKTSRVPCHRLQPQNLSWPSSQVHTLRQCMASCAQNCWMDECAVRNPPKSYNKQEFSPTAWKVTHSQKASLCPALQKRRPHQHGSFSVQPKRCLCVQAT